LIEITSGLRSNELSSEKLIRDCCSDQPSTTINHPRRSAGLQRWAGTALFVDVFLKRMHAFFDGAQAAWMRAGGESTLDSRVNCKVLAEHHSRNQAIQP
jgi:hypothetical protein